MKIIYALVLVLLLSACSTNTDTKYKNEDCSYPIEMDDSDDNMEQAIYNLWNQR